MHEKTEAEKGGCQEGGSQNTGAKESRGEDLAALRLGIVDHLRRIASGQLLPEIVVHCSGYPALLRIAANLPIPDQKRLVDGEPVEMAVWRGEDLKWIDVDPLALTQKQLRVVFGGDRIRNRQEQEALLEP